MLFECVADLAAVGQASPHGLEILNGHIQWQNLLNRPMYSCLDCIYDFIHSVPSQAQRALPPSVVSELMLTLCLAIFLECRFDTPLVAVHACFRRFTFVWLWLLQRQLFTGALACCGGGSGGSFLRGAIVSGARR